jgi:6-phosphogluconolactonase (cycloisomerase 2 family)
MGSTKLTVTSPSVVLLSIAVTPANRSIGIGATQQFTATGTFSDNTTKDITSSVTWASLTTATATISTGGLATALAGGTSTIQATSGTVVGSTKLTVITLVSIAVTPANPSVGIGATQQFTATGTFSDNSTKDITSSVTWASLTTATATISTGGLASAVHQGTSTITATLGTATPGSTLLTVTGPTLQSIQITPLSPTIPVGGTADFTGVGLYSDGSTLPLSPITWSTTAAASSVSVNGTTGVTLGLVPGTYPIKATGGGVTGNTQLTVVAGAARFAYVANGGDGSISIYAVNGSTFTPRGYVLDGHSAIQAIPDPSGRYVFALNALDFTISTYYVDPIGGGLTDASTLATPVVPVINGPGAGFLPYQGIVDPTGQFLYVADLSDSNITAFSINTANGSLTAIGSPITTGGTSPTMVLTDRSGTYLYAIYNNGGLAGSIYGFSINPGTGALTPLTPTPPLPAFPVSTGLSPFIGTIDPSNRFLYVSDNGDDTVAGFTIDSASGALIAMAGSPFVVTGTSLNPVGPDAVAVDPLSKYLYVANNAAETVSVFGITPGTGVLTGGTPPTTLFPPVSSSPTGAAVGSGPFSMSIDPAGTFLVVPNQFSNSLAVFSLSSATGALTAADNGGNLESRPGPQYANIYFASSAPTLSPAAVFASNSTAGTISEYTASNGALTATAAPETGQAGNSSSTTDITGKYFYTTSGSANNLSGFNVTQATAALAGLSGSPYTAPAPSSVVADPSDRYVFIAETGAPGTVQGFTLDTVTNSLNPITDPNPPGPPSVTNLKSIVQDPQGQSLYGLGLNLVQSLPVNVTTGVVTAGTALTPTGTWTSGAVDASGQYLIALDSVGKNIQVFMIGPLATFGVDTVSNPPGSPSINNVGTSPNSLVVDPLNRFVFVTDAGTNSILRYSFDPLSGDLTLLTGTTALTGIPGQATIDATGNFLYVAVEGNPTSNPGSVAAFKINTDGSLTPLANSPYPAGVGTSGVAVSNNIK